MWLGLAFCVDCWAPAVVAFSTMVHVALILGLGRFACCVFLYLNGPWLSSFGLHGLRRCVAGNLVSGNDSSKPRLRFKFQLTLTKSI